MTNTQLLLTIGFPSLLVILSWFSNNKGLERLEKGLERLEGRVNRLKDRISRLEEKMDHRFDILTGQIISLHERVAVVETKQE